MCQIVPSLDQFFREYRRFSSPRPQHGQSPTLLWPEIFIGNIVIFPTRRAFTRWQLDELTNAVANFSGTPCFFPEFDVESGIGEEQLHSAFHFGPDREPTALSVLRHTNQTIDMTQFVRDLDFASASLG